MKTLYVRNVPEGLHAKLKRLATRNRRSLGAQVVILVDQALRQVAPQRSRSEALDRIEKRLKRYAAPLDAPDSVSMLREDRRR
jgi:plasmid stability protein